MTWHIQTAIDEIMEEIIEDYSPKKDDQLERLCSLFRSMLQSHIDFEIELRHQLLSLVEHVVGAAELDELISKGTKETTKQLIHGIKAVEALAQSAGKNFDVPDEIMNSTIVPYIQAAGEVYQVGAVNAPHAAAKAVLTNWCPTIDKSKNKKEQQHDLAAKFHSGMDATRMFIYNLTTTMANNDQIVDGPSVFGALITGETFRSMVRELKKGTSNIEQ